MIELATIVSLASLGFRAITDKGMILYFLKKPFEAHQNTLVRELAKPFILCSTCMASVHTLVWFPILNGGYSIKVVPVMLMVAILNTIIWQLVENLRK